MIFSPPFLGGVRCKFRLVIGLTTVSPTSVATVEGIRPMIKRCIQSPNWSMSFIVFLGLVISFRSNAAEPNAAISDVKDRPNIVKLY